MTTPRTRRLTRPGFTFLAVQCAALLVGSLLIAWGLLGFIPTVTDGTHAMQLVAYRPGVALFGIFAVSLLHNLFHIALGLCGLLMARSYGRSRTYLLAGGALGLLAAARKGWVEELIMRLSDFSFAFPAILSAIMMTAVFGAGIVNAIVAIGLYNIPTFARVTRASANAVWSRDFILAARSCGKSQWSITFEHVLPNIASVLIVQATIQFAIAILAEAALSYLGLGTQPPQPSWGRMLSEAQTLLFQSPMLAVYPGVVIALAVLGLNLLGDGLRDLLDPRLARTR